MKVVKLLVLTLVVLSMSACAQVNIKRVKPGDYKTEGIRYYMAAPYLMVRAAVEIERTEKIFEVADDGKTVRIAPAEMVSKVGIRKGDLLGPHSSPSTIPTQAFGESLASTAEVVWLPDYCEQYAVNGDAGMNKLKLDVTLSNGWALSSVAIEADSSAAAGKLVDLLGTLVGAGKELGLKSMQQAGGEEEPEGGAASSGGDLYPGLLLRKTELKHIQPGLYPLSGRKEDNCSNRPVFAAPAFQLRTTVRWSTVPVSQPGKEYLPKAKVPGAGPGEKPKKKGEKPKKKGK